MTGINSSYDRHLDPPDTEEATFCEECGQEEEYHEFTYSGGYPSDKWTTCENQFCPAKFKDNYKPVVVEMAEKLVDTLDTVSTLEKKVKFLTRKITALEFHRDEKE